MSLIQQLSNELGVTPETLVGAFQVGQRSSRLDALRAVIENAKQVDATKTAMENDTLQPLRDQLAAAESEVEAKRMARRQGIAAWESHWDEQRQQSSGQVNVPSQEEVDAVLNA